MDIREQKNNAEACEICGSPSEAGHMPDCLVLRQQKLAAKVEAIGKQSPGLAAAEIAKLAEEEVAAGKEIIGAVDVGFRWYEINAESREQMNKWKAAIEEIDSSLKTGIESSDFSELKQVLGGEKIHHNDLVHIKRRLNRATKEFQQEGVESLSNEARKLFAISLWMEQQQGGEWSGFRRIIWKLLTKNSDRLAKILDKSGVASCIDTSYATKALAEELGIKGEVKVIEGKKIGDIAHRYFETEDGKVVVDYWLNRGQGGISPRRYFDERMQKNRSPLNCGQKEKN